MILYSLTLTEDAPVADLIARSPAAGLLPLQVGSVSIAEVSPGPLTSVAPFNGQAEAVSDALKTSVGAGLPPVNRRDGAVTWFGQGQWLVAGEVAPSGAAVTDQSDAWVVVSVTGDAVTDVLARLVPVDLRMTVFPEGQVAKTMLAHMPVTIIRTGDAAFEIMAMRSMAATLVHELETAAKGLALRD